MDVNNIISKTYKAQNRKKKFLQKFKNESFVKLQKIGLPSIKDENWKYNDLKNIIDNAQRYADKIHIEVSSNEDECFIAISDNGPGIPEKNFEDVFKPFLTLDPSRNKLKGESGLGMTIARDIIRSHGGDIKLYKSFMGGLKTVIDLPL